MADVSFIVGNALTADERRAHEQRLVHTYHEALVAAGVSSYSRTGSLGLGQRTRP
jgi:hypothetical protein